jgi:hypothetical protein
MCSCPDNEVIGRVSRDRAETNAAEYKQNLSSSTEARTAGAQGMKGLAGVEKAHMGPEANAVLLTVVIIQKGKNVVGKIRDWFTR